MNKNGHAQELKEKLDTSLIIISKNLINKNFYKRDKSKLF